MLRSLIAAIVCTHNRSFDALDCVEALRRQYDDETGQIILVDSASDASHQQRLRAYALAHPEILFRRCEEAGLSVARNSAAQLADAEWLAYLDDDAVPAPDWWSTAVRLSGGVAGDVAMIGGRILPRWPTPARPPHVGRRWLIFLSCIEETEQEDAEWAECYGANLMVRRDALEQVGGFPTKLGRIGSVLLSGEENRLQVALRRHGLLAAYRGALTVEHKIQQERLTRDWVARRAFWGGVSEMVAAREDGVLPRHLNPAKVAAASLLLSVSALWRDPQADRLIRARYSAGVLAGWWWTRRGRTLAVAGASRESG